MPALDELGRKYGSRGVVVLAINVGEEKSRYESFVREHNYVYLKWARDNTREIGKAYRVRGIPTLYVLDKEGIIRYAHVGYGSSRQEAFAQEIEALLR